MRFTNSVRLVIIILIASNMLSAEESLRLACNIYDTVNIDKNTSIARQGLPWIWAKSAAGNYIYALGEYVDGFFEIDQVYEKETFLGLEVGRRSQTNSYKQAMEFCKNAVNRAYESDASDKIVLKPFLKAHFLSLTGITPVFMAEQPVQEIDRIVFFGDSLSDQGNLKNWLRAFPPRPYVAGRFTRGLNHVDQFELHTGTPVHNWSVGGSASAEYLDLNYHKQSAMEVIRNSSIRLADGHVNNQILRYKKFSLANQEMRKANSTLFVIWIGGNDYFDRAMSNDADTFIDEPKHPILGADAEIERVTKNIISGIKSIYAAGGRKFAIFNLPDLGIIPKVLDCANYHSKGKESDDAKALAISLKLTDISKRHNQELIRRIDKFLTKHQDAHIISVDAFWAMKNVLASRSLAKPHRFFHYGLDVNYLVKLENLRQSATVNRACFQFKGANVLLGRHCSMPNQTLFFDHIHPSEFAHSLIALTFHRALIDAQFFANDRPFPNYIAHGRKEFKK
jgi:phospholipase/lecithinase/hemolysin